MITYTVLAKKFNLPIVFGLPVVEQGKEEALIFDCNQEIDAINMGLLFKANGWDVVLFVNGNPMNVDLVMDLPIRGLA